MYTTCIFAIFTIFRFRYLFNDFGYNLLVINGYVFTITTIHWDWY